MKTVALAMASFLLSAHFAVGHEMPATQFSCVEVTPTDEWQGDWVNAEFPRIQNFDFTDNELEWEFGTLQLVVATAERWDFFGGYAVVSPPECHELMRAFDRLPRAPQIVEAIANGRFSESLSHCRWSFESLSPTVVLGTSVFSFSVARLSLISTGRTWNIIVERDGAGLASSSLPLSTALSTDREIYSCLPSEVLAEEALDLPRGLLSLVLDGQELE